MARIVRARNASCFLFVVILLVGCSRSGTSTTTVPEPRKAAFSNSQPGNGGCTALWGCPIQELCWDGSEPDPFDGGCTSGPPAVGGPQQQPPPPCSMSAATLAPTPLPRDRTTLGVGEQVALSSADGSTWSANGAGTLDRTTGGNVTLTANDEPGTATVTVSAQGCVATTRTYSVIAPTGLLLVRFNGVKHTKGLADTGMQARVYLQPDTVSFTGLYYLEQDAFAAASGIYVCWNGASHNPNPLPLQSTQNSLLGLGTLVATDTVEDGACGGTDQHGNGSLSFTIPEMYKVGSDGTQHQVTLIHHLGTASAGALSLQKGAAAASTTVDSPTSSY
jgi:hypothetical protein